jgi:hypothetical protein
MSAKLANVIFLAYSLEILGYFLAFRAEYSVWVASFKKELKAILISCEALVKIFQRKSCVIHLSHPYTYILAQNLLYVKG